ncbi:D-amino acid aminotransferase [Candidatus Woesearchaeota archaeon]|jgi:D-alanine transaminase|nr:D-amino acid aminotransferase [Candidatus Woesearchaeota archaeon]
MIYLNGHFMPVEEAKVSVLDRGFLFGDGVYEVIPVYGGQPFRLPEHLRRLDDSLRGIRMTSPLDDDEWLRIFTRLITGTHDQYLYLQVTRGAAPKRDHAIPPGIAPTVFVMCSPIVPVAPEGVKAVTVPDIRWQWCHIKAVTLLSNVLLRQEALDRGAIEGILVREGRVIEGAASNVFAVLKGVLVTPPKSHELLPGITRDLVLELARANGIPCEERTMSLDEVKQADEIWLTSSTREILPVILLDETPVGTGQPGPLWTRLHQLYQTYKETLRNP